MQYQSCRGHNDVSSRVRVLILTEHQYSSSYGSRWWND